MNIQSYSKSHISGQQTDVATRRKKETKQVYIEYMPLKLYRKRLYNSNDTLCSTFCKSVSTEIKTGKQLEAEIDPLKHPVSGCLERGKNVSSFHVDQGR